MVQAWAPDFAYTYSLNGVAWSLSCEVLFYLLFPFIVTALRGLSVRTLAIVGFGLFAVVSCAVLATTLIGAGPAVEAIRYTNPLVRLPEFVLGVCAALAMRSGWTPKLWHGAVLLAVAAVGFVAVSDKPAGDVWGTLIFLAAIVGFAQADCSRPVRIMQSKPLIYAGEVSFGFYLVHQLVVVHSVHLLGTGVTVGVLAFLASVLCAVALHHGVERPANKALLARLGSRKAYSRSVG